MTDDLYSWLALKKIPGIGTTLYMRLLERFASPEAVFASPQDELCSVNGISHDLAGRITSFNRRDDELLREIETLNKLNIDVITINSDLYPANLRNIYDPPPFLFVKGSLLETDNISLAVVGTRKASSYGLLTAKKLCSELSSYNITIISGMARGIDTAAHKAVLPNRTIAVLGSGFLKIYPQENIKLAHEIAEKGALISEYFPEEPPEAHHFPVRNRIISGLSMGTLVIEAQKKSGSLITSRLASEQGREVFAVPGNINTLQSKGTNRLIKQGAKLVEGVDDIIEELLHLLPEGWISSTSGDKNNTTPLNGLSKEELLVYNALSGENMHIDELVTTTQLEPDKIASSLLLLELKDLVVKGPGAMFTTTFL